jgi:hypothetical protein
VEAKRARNVSRFGDSLIFGNEGILNDWVNPLPMRIIFHAEEIKSM